MNIIEWITSLDLRGFNEISVTLRLVLAVLCGGIIGLEREQKNRPAGFRTHILICIGATITMLTTQYLQTLKYISPDNFVSDPARIGAQVIAGMGFIGAGTIIVTKRKQVRGLTTAAGLWATAILGLAIGVGCYEISIYATAMTIIVEVVFSKLEWKLVKSTRETNLYVEVAEGEGDFNAVMNVVKAFEARVIDVEITKSRDAHGSRMSAIFNVKFKKRTDLIPVKEAIEGVCGVKTVEIL